jgi:hypothetical protein
VILLRDYPAGKMERRWLDLSDRNQGRPDLAALDVKQDLKRLRNRVGRIGSRAMLLSIGIVARELGLRRAALLIAIDAGEVPAERDANGCLKIRREDAVAYGEKLKAAADR